MPSLLPERRNVNGRELLATAITEAQAAVQRQMSERLNQLLAPGVDHLLGRAACVRRAAQQVTWEQSGRCSNCKSQPCDHFSRHGYRPRTLGCLDYHLQLRLPRGWSADAAAASSWTSRVSYALINASVTMWMRRSQRWSQMGHSLRDMRTELRHGHLGPLGLRTLCEHTGWRFSSGWYPYRNDLSGNGSVARSAIVASPATRD